jgi:pyruvate dehydrogenase E1 component alpha subunit
MSDPGKYRTQAELDDHKKRDPLFRAREDLLSAGIGEAALASIDRGVDAEVADSAEFADSSPQPDISVLEPTTYSGPFAY